MTFQVGDDASLLAYLDRVAPDLYRFVSRVTGGDRQLTQDIVHEAVSALVRQARSRALNEVDTGWLMTAARKGFIDRVRSRAGHDRSPERQQKPEASLASAGEVDKMSVEQARRLLRRLPDRERWALGLQAVDGLSVAEVATALGWTFGATKAVIGGGHRRLRDLVGNDQPIDEHALYDRAAEDISSDFLGKLRMVVTAGHRTPVSEEPPTTPVSSRSTREREALRQRRKRVGAAAAAAVVTILAVAAIVTNNGNQFVAPVAPGRSGSGSTPSAGATLQRSASDDETTSPSATSIPPTSTAQATSTTPATDNPRGTGNSQGTGNPQGTGDPLDTGNPQGTGDDPGEPPAANVTDVSGPWPVRADEDPLPLSYLLPTTSLDGLRLQRKSELLIQQPSVDQGSVRFDQVLLSADATVQLRITTQAEPTSFRPANDRSFAIGPWLATPVSMANGFSALDLQADAGVVRLWSHGLTNNELSAIGEGLVRRGRGRPGWDLSVRPGGVEPFAQDWQLYGPLRTMGWYTVDGVLKGELDYGLIGFDGLAADQGLGDSRSSTIMIRGRRVVVTIGDDLIRMWWEEAPGSYGRFGLNDGALADAIAIVESLTESGQDAWLALPEHAVSLDDDGCDSLFC